MFAASASGVRLAQLPPLALYVHIPWCVKKCPYCDFNSHQAKENVPEKAYIEALVSDLEQALAQVWGRRVSSVFFGGGTPSLFSAGAIETLISAFRARLTLTADCEVTLEANPGTFEAEKFRGYRDAGVTRLSIGIQSFNPKHLQALGRIHDDREARRAIEMLGHVLADGAWRDLQAKLEPQFIGDAPLAPREVVARYLPDESLQLHWDGWASRARCAAPEPSETLAPPPLERHSMHPYARCTDGLRKPICPPLA